MRASHGVVAHLLAGSCKSVLSGGDPEVPCEALRKVTFLAKSARCTSLGSARRSRTDLQRQ